MAEAFASIALGEGRSLALFALPLQADAQKLVEPGCSLALLSHVMSFKFQQRPVGAVPR